MRGEKRWTRQTRTMGTWKTERRRKMRKGWTKQIGRTIGTWKIRTDKGDE